MTNAELKEKISKAPEQEWFKSISVTFNFSIDQQLTFTGLSAIYEFVNQQINGWNTLDKLPNELNQNKRYFANIQNAIINFVNNYSHQNANILKSYWQNQVLSHINTVANYSAFPYNIPETDFLIKVFQDIPNSFQGAYHFILRRHSDLSNPNSLYGAILAYEFTHKGKAEITNRRKSEQSSLSKLKNDFQKYLSESELHLITHLNKYTDHAKAIDNLKIEKENLFTNWFENTKNEEWKNWFEDTKNKQWKKWFDPTTQKIADLEQTYKEKLKLEEPAKYWEDRAKKLRKQGWFSLAIFVVLIIIICAFLGFILWNPPEIFKASILSEDKSIAIKWILIYATLLSFLAYCVRALSKTMFSSFHLARDCEERYTLTYFYLSLLKDSTVTDSDRQLIMQSLFSRADTGLLKEDSSPTMPNDVINKVMSK